MTPASPGRVLQRSLLVWGLGDLELGRRRAAFAWLAAEALGLAAIVYLTLALADTTWHLIPYLAGVGFVAAWGWQAVTAYRRAQRTHGAIAPPTVRSPAAGIAWLALPLLAWGGGFWLFSTDAASPAAVLDRVVSAWSEAGPAAKGEAIVQLASLCAAGRLARDCATDPAELFRDVRFVITDADAEHANAVAEVVEFRRRPARFLWVFETTETLPVAREPVLRISLMARDARLPPGIEIGARRWEIVTIRPG